MSETTIVQRKYGIYSPLRSQRQIESINIKKLTDEEKNKLALILLLTGVSRGSLLYHREYHAEPGFIEIYDKEKDRYVPHSLTLLNGFKTSDLLKTWIGQLLAPNIEKFLKILLENKMILEGDNYDGETLYKISDNDLEKFVIACINLCNMISERIEREFIVYGFRKSRDSLIWYEQLLGKNELTKRIMSLQDNGNLRKTRHQMNTMNKKDFGDAFRKAKYIGKANKGKLLTYWTKIRANGYVNLHADHLKSSLKWIEEQGTYKAKLSFNLLLYERNG